MLDNLAVVLVRTKYPENVGSAARACLNMGVSELVLVDPLNLDLDKALPLATTHAKTILESARIEPDLATALSGFQAAWGTTARTGGWRKGIMTPATCARVVLERLTAGDRVALVFGPEDTGLTNEETSLCTGLATIPTARDGTSLNLAQAVLILLYECFTASLEKPFEPAGPPAERACTMEETATLFTAMQQALTDMDYLRQQSPEYWMLPMKRFFARFRLTRNEFNLLMGVCRQASWLSEKAGITAGQGLGGTGPVADKTGTAGGNGADGGGETGA